MKLLRAATLSVSDPEASAARYADWLDYRIVEHGRIDADLAASWGAPRCAGRRYVTVQPASAAPVFIRFVAGDVIPAYRPLRTYGWAALEICVADVLQTHERMVRSPFEVIGPPREIDGLPAIFAMQVKGADDEIVYLTQIRSDPTGFNLPRAAAPIDKLFIVVLACSDLNLSRDWFERHARLTLGRDIDIVYTMLAKSFGLPLDGLHRIVTLTHERDVFLELDQYPDGATPRPVQHGQLPPGIAITTLQHPQFAELTGPWVTAPVRRGGVVYAGNEVATLVAPDGTLMEMVAAD